MSPSPKLVRERKLDQSIALLVKQIEKLKELIQECHDIFTTVR